MSRGGAERVVSILSDYYAKKGWNVEILMVLHNKIEYEIHPNVKVVDISKEGNKILGLMSLIKRIRNHVNEVSPDVIVAFMAQISLVTGLACKKQLDKVICSERIDPAMVHRNALYKSILNKIYSKCDCTVLQTKRAWSYFPEAVQKNSVIIGNPVRVQFVAEEKREHKIATAGRLTEQKNQKMLINAFSAVHKLHPEYTLDIYGEGPLRAQLQELINEKGLQDSVTLAGNVSDLHKRMSVAEMFVLSSDYEGLSNALLEAMMMGLPCISTDCAGSDEAITSGENGILVPVGNEEKLTEAMLRLIENENYRNQLAEAAKASADKYKVENIIQQWAEVIEGV
jgi:glycosyltransferase involved in cell wall biosynthesis